MIGILHGSIGECASELFPNIYSRAQEESILSFIKTESGLEFKSTIATNLRDECSSTLPSLSKATMRNVTGNHRGDIIIYQCDGKDISPISECRSNGRWSKIDSICCSILIGRTTKSGISLRNAAKTGDLSKVSNLIDNGVDVIIDSLYNTIRG